MIFIAKLEGQNFQASVCHQILLPPLFFRYTVLSLMYSRCNTFVGWECVLLLVRRCIVTCISTWDMYIEQQGLYAEEYWKRLVGHVDISGLAIYKTEMLKPRKKITTQKIYWTPTMPWHWQNDFCYSLWRCVKKRWHWVITSNDPSPTMQSTKDHAAPNDLLGNAVALLLN